MPAPPDAGAPPLIDQIRAYWNGRIHDQAMSNAAAGTLAFFDDLDDYRFDKLRYLPRLVDFDGYRGQRLLEIGCGIGTDLVRFARGGARVTGVDLAQQAIDLARRNVELHGVADATLEVADGEALPFGDASFDAVYAHGAVQYTADPARLISEAHRVLRPGGEAIVMVYNRRSWLSAMSALTGTALEHADAPVLRTFTIAEFRRLLDPFAEVRIVPERFPVPSRLHKGWKATVYNRLFVGTFNALPRRLVRPLGWHLMAFCRTQGKRR